MNATMNDADTLDKKCTAAMLTNSPATELPNSIRRHLRAASLASIAHNPTSGTSTGFGVHQAPDTLVQMIGCVAKAARRFAHVGPAELIQEG
jgi:hypothetical protein